MNLQEFKFPEISGVMMVFPTLETDETLLEEAKARNCYDGSTKGNKLFHELFYHGMKSVPPFLENLDQEFILKAWRYCKALMGSFEPKHQEKEAVCAMILNEIVDFGKLVNEEGVNHEAKI